jgi:hypothetical protein
VAEAAQRIGLVVVEAVASEHLLVHLVVELQPNQPLAQLWLQITPSPLEQVELVEQRILVHKALTQFLAVLLQ